MQDQQYQVRISELGRSGQSQFEREEVVTAASPTGALQAAGVDVSHGWDGIECPQPNFWHYVRLDDIEVEVRAQQGKPVGPGKKIHRISAFRTAGADYVDCMIYHILSADSLGIRSIYCQLSTRQYSHLADVVNEAAERGFGEVEAHNAVPGFVWHQPAYRPAPYTPSSPCAIT